MHATCNAMLYGITDNLFRRLQLIQNAAERLLTGTRRRDHISPVLSRLHWLPVKQRVVFKLAILLFKSLRGETPSYLADDCELIGDSGRRRLCSADANALTVPRTYTRFGDRSFSVAGPNVWNSLLATLRKPNIEFLQFKPLLKTFLIGETEAHWRLFVHNAPCINWLTHSLTHGICKAFLSVCLSVRLSVKHVDYDKTRKTCAHILMSRERLFILVLWHFLNGWWGRPLLPEILGQTDPVGAKTPILIDIRS